MVDPEHLAAVICRLETALQEAERALRAALDRIAELERELVEARET